MWEEMLHVLSNFINGILAWYRPFGGTGVYGAREQAEMRSYGAGTFTLAGVTAGAAAFHSAAASSTPVAPLYSLANRSDRSTSCVNRMLGCA